jgi:hypothetical protein
MDRRKFLTAGTAAASASALAGCRPNTETAASRPTAAEKPVRLHVGTQRPSSDEWLSLSKRHGVNHVCASLPGPPYPERGFHTVEELTELRERCESHGVTADMLTAPFLPSSHIDREERGDIMLGTSRAVSVTSTISTRRSRIARRLGSRRSNTTCRC